MKPLACSILSMLVIVVWLVAGAEAAAKARPFKAKGDAQVSANPLDGALFTASGTATHLGKFFGEGQTVFTPNDDGTYAVTGSITFVAANGDELKSTFEGTLDPTTGLGTATFTYDGGTGRFSDAAGQADFIVVQDAPGEFNFSFTGEGTLSY